MAQPQPEVYWTWTPSHLTLLPDHLPRTVPPPITEASLRAPFGIDKTLYNAALRPEFPFVFAVVYIITVFDLNAYNRRRNHEPWSVSKTKAFGYFVVAHNVFLALYSFATFAALGRAVAHSLPPWDADNWTVRAADGLCKLHGPRGLGDAATFNTSIHIWEVKNTAIKLTGSGIPDPTDVGRLWNEGLAFWGWFFYVSKFYEAVDTFIVLAKGKRSATLQTYHHAGALLCMWAGIRYMSPPIWMFVFVNSGIHALMYTYFTASALGIHVPQALKRTLTILQISQFVWGASYAAAHLFIQYDIPITTPFQVVHAIQRAASSAQSAASTATSAASSAVESPTIATALGWYLKKLLLRAAGEEGVAERLAFQQQHQFQFQPGGIQNPLNLIPSIPPSKIEEKIQHIFEHRFVTRYKQDWSRVNCIDTTGEAFAIYLNLLYLSPLTWLFVRFFVRAYSQRGREERTARSRRSASEVLHEAALAARKARMETKETIEEGGEKVEKKVEEKSSQAEEEVRRDVEKVIDELRSGSGLQAGVSKVEEVGRSVIETVGRKVEEVRQQVSSSSTQQEESSTSATQHQESSFSTQQESSSSTQQESSSSSSFKQQEKRERQSSSTWIKGGGGLFRRNWKSEDGSAKNGEDTVQSEEKQDANLEDSQATRPEPEDDSDAMGRSGAIVDAEDTQDGGKAAAEAGP